MYRGEERWHVARVAVTDAHLDVCDCRTAWRHCAIAALDTVRGHVGVDGVGAHGIRSILPQLGERRRRRRPAAKWDCKRGISSCGLWLLPVSIVNHQCPFRQTLHPASVSRSVAFQSDATHGLELVGREGVGLFGFLNSVAKGIAPRFFARHFNMTLLQQCLR